MDDGLFLTIIDYLKDDMTALSRVSLANKFFNAYTTVELYRTVVIPSISAIPDIEDVSIRLFRWPPYISPWYKSTYYNSKIFNSYNSKIYSSCLPKNVPHVRDLTIGASLWMACFVMPAYEGSRM